MILKALLTFFGSNAEFAVVLDIILGLTVLHTREIKLILLYLVILIVALVSELFFRQMEILDEYQLTAQNIEKLEGQKLELHSDVRLTI